MKKLLILFMAIAFVACNSDDDSGDANTNEFEQIKTTLPQGEWEVSTFIEAGVDQTPVFESFIFDFNADGTVRAQNDLFTENGTWAYDNSANGSEKLNLQFSGTTPFDRIDEDWAIISVSNSKIELSRDNENGDTDLLTFIKL